MIHWCFQKHIEEKSHLFKYLYLGIRKQFMSHIFMLNNLSQLCQKPRMILHCWSSPGSHFTIKDNWVAIDIDCLQSIINYCVISKSDKAPLNKIGHL